MTPPWAPNALYFLRDIFHVKGPKLSENPKNGTITLGSMRDGACSSQTPRILLKSKNC